MSRQIRRVALLLLLLFGALFVNVNYLQVYRAADLANDPRNSRGLIEQYQTRRGLLVAGDTSTQIAGVEETEGSLRYQRRYTDGPLYAPITGYQSIVYGTEESERTFNDYLQGSSAERFARNLTDLLLGRDRAGDDVILNVLPAAQQAAREQLGDQRGAVVAIAPATGEILALWSNPTYDPNRMSSFDRPDITAYWEQLLNDPERPLANRAVRETYPPGSTFKLVTAAAALESGIAPEEAFDDPERAELPETTATIGNFGGGRCNGGEEISLTQALQVSCNTTFAQLGLDLGGEALVAQAQAFGFDAPVFFQLPSPAESRMPDEINAPQAAQTAIGQYDVRATPLQMALVSATIANGGELMTPRLAREVRAAAGGQITSFDPEPLVPAGASGSQAVSEQTAATLTDMMVGVVEGGTGSAARIDGVQVAGKTGTAQTAEGRAPTVWFTGFAPADDPQVAVAVMIEDGGGVGDEATGGALAAPVAKAVMEAALAFDGSAEPEQDG